MGEPAEVKGIVNAAGESVTQESFNTQLKELSDLKASVEKLNVSLTEKDQKISDADNALLSPEYIDYLDKKAKGELNPKTPEVDIDNMTAKERADWILAQGEARTKTTLKTLTDQVMDRLTKIESSLGIQRATIDVKSFIAGEVDGEKHDDFWTYKNEMQKLANDNPKLTAQDLYTLAKSKADKVKAKEAEDAIPESERPGTSIKTLEEKQLPKDKAAELAWRKTFGNKTSVTGD